MKRWARTCLILHPTERSKILEYWRIVERRTNRALRKIKADDICRIADLQQLHEIFLFYSVVNERENLFLRLAKLLKAAIIAHIFYIG
jgi:hypothetical protein